MTEELKAGGTGQPVRVTASRRSFLASLTTGLVGAGLVVAVWPYIRSLAPNVFYEPPRRFKLGPPDRFPQGVSYLEAQRAYIFREGNTFHALSAICTHLGCTVKFAPFRTPQEMEVRKLTYKSIGEFRCPCHGSKFRDEGTNYAGPAPRPLPWLHIEISPADGQLVVDLSREVDRGSSLVV